MSASVGCMMDRKEMRVMMMDVERSDMVVVVVVVVSRSRSRSCS